MAPEIKDTPEPESSIVMIVGPELEELAPFEECCAGFGRVFRASGGEEALEAIASLERSEALVLILAVQNMDGMSGVNFFRQTLGYVPRAMRILYGEDANPDVLIEAINRARVHQYVSASFERHAFEGVITRFMSNFSQFLRQNAYLRDLEQTVEEQSRKLEARSKELEEINLTDNLTGLRNRRYLLKYLNADISKVRRDYFDWVNDRAPSPPAASDLVFFMLRLDTLDAVYDSYGQAAGNGVLIHLKDVLSAIFREYDFLVRWEECTFLVVARYVRRVDAPMLAQRICKTISEFEFLTVEGDRLDQTCSVGYAPFPFLTNLPDHFSWSQVVDMASHFMKASQLNGGNLWLGLEAASSSDGSLSFQSVISETHQLIETSRLIVKSSHQPTGGAGENLCFPSPFNETSV